MLRGEFAVVPHPIAIPADVDDVAVMQEPVDQRPGHDVITEDLALRLEALVAGEHGGRVRKRRGNCPATCASSSHKIRFARVA